MLRLLFFICIVLMSVISTVEAVNPSVVKSILGVIRDFSISYGASKVVDFENKPPSSDKIKVPNKNDSLEKIIFHPITTITIKQRNEVIKNTQFYASKANSIAEFQKVFFLKSYQKALQYYENHAYKEAFSEFETLSQEGYAEPSFMIGRMYCYGKYIVKGVAHANQYFKKSGSKCICLPNGGALRC